jgi:ankyrin repeat protein
MNKHSKLISYIFTAVCAVFFSTQCAMGMEKPVNDGKEEIEQAARTQKYRKSVEALSAVDKQQIIRLETALKNCDALSEKLSRLVQDGQAVLFDRVAYKMKIEAIFCYALVLRQHKIEQIAFSDEAFKDINEAITNYKHIVDPQLITLINGINAGDLSLVKAILKAHTLDLNSFDEHFFPPLFYAIMHNRKDMVLALTDAGASVNVRYFDGLIPLLLVDKDMVEIRTILLNLGADIDFVDARGETPLATAIGTAQFYDSPMVVNALLARNDVSLTKKVQGKTIAELIGAAFDPAKGTTSESRELHTRFLCALTEAQKRIEKRKEELLAKIQQAKAAPQTAAAPKDAKEAAEIQQTASAANKPSAAAGSRLDAQSKDSKKSIVSLSKQKLAATTKMFKSVPKRTPILRTFQPSKQMVDEIEEIARGTNEQRIRHMKLIHPKAEMTLHKKMLIQALEAGIVRILRRFVDLGFAVETVLLKTNLTTLIEKTTPAFGKDAKTIFTVIKMKSFAYGDIVNQFETNTAFDAIVNAIHQGDALKLRLILKSDASLIDHFDECGLSPLFYAVVFNEIECVKVLLEFGADFMAFNRAGLMAPLLVQAKNNEIAQLFKSTPHSDPQSMLQQSLSKAVCTNYEVAALMVPQLLEMGAVVEDEHMDKIKERKVSAQKNKKNQPETIVFDAMEIMLRTHQLNAVKKQRKKKKLILTSGVLGDQIAFPLGLGASAAASSLSDQQKDAIAKLQFDEKEKLELAISAQALMNAHAICRNIGRVLRQGDDKAFLIDAWSKIMLQIVQERFVLFFVEKGIAKENFESNEAIAQLEKNVDIIVAQAFKEFRNNSLKLYAAPGRKQDHKWNQLLDAVLAFDAARIGQLLKEFAGGSSNIFFDSITVQLFAVMNGLLDKKKGHEILKQLHSAGAHFDGINDIGLSPILLTHEAFGFTVDELAQYGAKNVSATSFLTSLASPEFSNIMLPITRSYIAHGLKMTPVLIENIKVIMSHNASDAYIPVWHEIKNYCAEHRQKQKKEKRKKEIAQKLKDEEESAAQARDDAKKQADIAEQQKAAALKKRDDENRARLQREREYFENQQKAQESATVTPSKSANGVDSNNAAGGAADPVASSMDAKADNESSGTANPPAQTAQQKSVKTQLLTLTDKEKSAYAEEREKEHRAYNARLVEERGKATATLFDTYIPPTRLNNRNAAQAVLKASEAPKVKMPAQQQPIASAASAAQPKPKNSRSKTESEVVSSRSGSAGVTKKVSASAKMQNEIEETNRRIAALKKQLEEKQRKESADAKAIADKAHVAQKNADEELTKRNEELAQMHKEDLYVAPLAKPTATAAPAMQHLTEAQTNAPASGSTAMHSGRLRIKPTISSVVKGVPIFDGTLRQQFQKPTLVQVEAFQRKLAQSKAEKEALALAQKATAKRAQKMKEESHADAQFMAHQKTYPDFCDPSTIYYTDNNLKAWKKAHKVYANANLCSVCNKNGWAAPKANRMPATQSQLVADYLAQYRQDNPISAGSIFAGM